MIKVLATGTKGNIIKNIINCLKDEDIKFSKLEVKNSRTGFYEINNKIKFDDYDYVFHFGAVSDRNSKDYKKIYYNNILFTEKLISKLQSFPSTKLIFASANSIVSQAEKNIISFNTKPSPNDFYSLSKLIAENLISNYLKEKQYLIMRLPAVYGMKNKSNGLLNNLYKSILKNEKVKISKKQFYFNNATLIDNLATFLKSIVVEKKLFKPNKITLGSKSKFTLQDICKIMNRDKKGQIKKGLKTESNFYGYVVNNKDAIKLGYKPPSMSAIIDTIIYNS